MRTFTLTTEYIEMNKLIKLLQLTETGGQAKLAIMDGFVTVNNEPEFRLRRKLRKGDVMSFDGEEISIV